MLKEEFLFLIRQPFQIWWKI